MTRQDRQEKLFRAMAECEKCAQSVMWETI